jgi:hypothetical protein
MADLGTVKIVSIDSEMRSAYLDYAMSVIVQRALPDVRDGLKPVQRRILYAMHDEGLRPGTSYRKSAGAVGEVLKKYHPHGEIAVYDARAGQLRLDGRRQRGGDALHRGAHGQHRRRVDGRHRQGDGRFPAQL